MSKPPRSRLTGRIGIALLALGLASISTPTASPQSGSGARAAGASSVLVQGRDVDRVAGLLDQVGGAVTHELRIIDALAARLTVGQRSALERLDPGLRFYDNPTLTTSSDAYWPGLPYFEESGDGDDDQDSDGGEQGRSWSWSPVWGGIGYLDVLLRAFGDLGANPYSHFPALVGADRLHEAGLSGRGVTIAFVDTGFVAYDDLLENAEGERRLLAHYDAIADRETDDDEVTLYSDLNGHGGHVTSVAANSDLAVDGRYNGIAPNADLVVVKAFDHEGSGSYADIIRGIEWVVGAREAYGIRVLNLSFSGPALTFYWNDPLNQAVMEAWRAGIVVVASAGNLGPEPMTVGVPGNLPYVLTVGAMTDGFTPADPEDDSLASFSAAGPTAEGFVKPDLVAPGGHVMAQMNLFSELAKRHPEFHDGGLYFMMSGTSQATAVVSGAAALLLEAEPALTPDQVKARLMATARPALAEDGEPAYCALQQGAGLVDAWTAATLEANDPRIELQVNQGLDVDHDLSGVAHYLGPVRQAEDGSFHLEGSATASGFIWADISALTNGFIWADISALTDGFIWADISSWTAGFIWADSSAPLEEALGEVPLDAPIAINTWVEQE